VVSHIMLMPTLVCTYAHAQVKGICYQKDLDCVVTGGWDKTLRTWDPREAKVRPRFSSPVVRMRAYLFVVSVSVSL